MPDKILIDDFSVVQADDKMFLFLPAQKTDCADAKLFYNTKNVMLLQRDKTIVVLKDIPKGVRTDLAAQKAITIVEIAADNKTIVRGYEVETVINPDIPNEDKLSANFDEDFAFLKDILSAEDYQKFKNDAGF
jgi:hypothetical protein